jgi:hypothetical protein
MNALDNMSTVQLAMTDQITRPEPGPHTSAPVAALACPPDPESRYAHLGDIARGGMGQVALVHDTDVERQIAMKGLLPEFAASD